LDWKLFVQLAVTVAVALAGGWLGHQLAARRDLLNERRKLRVAYLLEAYRRLEDAGNRSDPTRSWPKFESAVADIQFLGSPTQVQLARRFAIDMAQRRTASLDGLIFDLRQSLREELQLPPVEEGVVYLRFNGQDTPRFDETLRATIRDVGDAKLESAAIAAPASRRLLDQQQPVGPNADQISNAWLALEELVSKRLRRAGVDHSKFGASELLRSAVDHDVITDAQRRSLFGLNTMRNLAVQGARDGDIDDARTREFLTLADAMKVVLEITDE
jgi:hypothetical protein